jgi:hypothetical protein
MVDETNMAPPNPNSDLLLIQDISGGGDPEGDAAHLQTADGTLSESLRSIVKLHDRSIATAAKSRPNRIGYRDRFQIGGRYGNGAADLGSNLTSRRRR